MASTRGRLAGTALALASAIVLAGCTTGASTDASPDAPAGTALDGTVTVFAAASLSEVFDALADSFEAEHPGVDVVVNYGGSSGLAEQLAQGAPADVFAAASEATMAIVVDAGLAGDPVTVATNTLEIATPAGNPAGVTGLADFARPELALAVCAKEVPCGAAAQTVFAAAGVTPSIDTIEQDVRAVLTKVQLGEVDAGIVYRTDVLAAGDSVTGVPFPEASDAVVRYPVAALAEAPNRAAAEAFVAWVVASRAVFERAGFGAP